SAALFVPVRSPELAIIYSEGEARGPAGQTGKLPSPHNRVHKTAAVVAEMPALAERQLSNPVGVDLVCGVEIGDGAGILRPKCIHETAPGRTNIVRAAEPEACGAGGEVNGLGIGVVQVELDTVV